MFSQKRPTSVFPCHVNVLFLYLCTSVGSFRVTFYNLVVLFMTHCGCIDVSSSHTSSTRRHWLILGLVGKLDLMMQLCTHYQCVLLLWCALQPNIFSNRSIKPHWMTLTFLFSLFLFLLHNYCALSAELTGSSCLVLTCTWKNKTPDDII